MQKSQLWHSDEVLGYSEIALVALVDQMKRMNGAQPNNTSDQRMSL